MLPRAVAIGKRHEQLAGTTLAQFHADLDRRLGRPMPNIGAWRKLFRAMRRDRADLLRFVIRRDVLCRGGQRDHHRAAGRTLSAYCAPGYGATIWVRKCVNQDEKL